MMEKLAQAGAHPPHFTIVTITYKVEVYAPADYTHPFNLYQYMYFVSIPTKSLMEL
jgi:hypothetical protein